MRKFRANKVYRPQRWGQHSWIQRATDRIFGFDFFISYSHAEGPTYPIALADQLAQRKFRVFLDTRVYRIGDDLNQATPRRVRMSRYLILIARPSAMKSEWVLREVEACVKARRIPLVIDINNTYLDASDRLPVKALIGGNERLFQSETLPITNNEIDGIPSRETIERVVGAFKGARQETMRLRLMSVAALVLTTLLVLTGIFAITTYLQFSLAKNNLALSFVKQAETALRDHQTNEALVLSAESLVHRDTLAARKIQLDSPVYPQLPSLIFDAGVNAIDFFPDGRRLAVGTDSGEIWIYDVFSGEGKQLPSTHESFVDDLSISPDGNKLVSSNFGQELWLWDLSSKPIAHKALPVPQNSPNETIFEPNFSPDGEVVAANLPNDEGVGLWRSEDGKVIGKSWLGNGADFSGRFERFSPTGERLVFSQESGFSQLEVGSQTALPLWQHPNTQVASFSDRSITSTYAFNRDGSRLAVGAYGRSILVFDTTIENSSGRRIQEFTPSLEDWQLPSSETVDVGFSDDGRLLVAASRFGSIIVWKANDPWSWSEAATQTVFRLPDEITINAMRVSPLSSLIAVACSDGKVRLWDISGGVDQLQIPLRHYLYQQESEFETLAPLQNSAATYATKVIFHPDGKTILVGGADGSLQQFDRQTGALLKITPQNLDHWETHGHNGQIKDLFIDSDDLRVVTFSEANILEFIGESWEPLPKDSFSSSLVVSAVSRSGKRMAVSTGDGTVEIWDVSTHPLQTIDAFPVPEGWSCEDISISEDGQVVALILQGTNTFQLQTRQIKSDRFESVIEPQEDRLHQVIFRPGGGLAVDTGDQIEFWQPSSSGYKLDSTLSQASSPIAVSSDGLWLAAEAGDDDIHIYNIESKALLATLEGHTGQVNGLQFSSEGKILASWSLDDSVRLWNLDRAHQQPSLLRQEIIDTTGWQMANGNLIPSAQSDGLSTYQTAALDILETETERKSQNRVSSRGSKSWRDWWNEQHPEGAKALENFITQLSAQ